MATITQEQLTPIEEQLKAVQQSTAEMMKRIAEEGIISGETGEVLVPPTLKIPDTDGNDVDIREDVYQEEKEGEKNDLCFSQ